MNPEIEKFYEELKREARKFKAGDIVEINGGGEGVVSRVNEACEVELMGDMCYYSPFVLRRKV